jgi:predicted MFS family arabinose efflux permease
MTVQSDPLLIPILSAANFVIGMGAFVVIGLLDPLADGLAMTTAQAGWVMTAYALSYAVLSPLLVSSTGRLGRRRVIAAGLAVFAIANVVMALAPEAAWVFFARIIAAAGAGIVTPVAAAVAAGVSAPEHRAKALSTVFIGLTLAQVIGVPAGSFIAYTFGWRAAFWIVALLSLPCIWLIWTRVPKGLSFQPVTLTDLRRVLGNGPLMLAILFTASFLGSVWIVFTYLAPLLTQQMGWGRNGITLALLVFGCGAVIGNVAGGILADKFGPIRTLLLLSCTQVVWLMLYSLLPIPEALLLVMIFFHSCCGWSFMAGQQARLVALAPETAPVVLSLNAAAIYVGAAVGSAIGSVVIDTTGLTGLGFTASAMAVIAVLHILLSARVSGDRQAATAR